MIRIMVSHQRLVVGSSLSCLCRVPFRRIRQSCTICTGNGTGRPLGIRTGGQCDYIKSMLCPAHVSKWERYLARFIVSDMKAGILENTAAKSLEKRTNDMCSTERGEDGYFQNPWWAEFLSWVSNRTDCEKNALFPMLDGEGPRLSLFDSDSVNCDVCSMPIMDGVASPHNINDRMATSSSLPPIHTPSEYPSSVVGSLL